jgi:hypothetical protein
VEKNKGHSEKTQPRKGKWVFGVGHCLSENRIFSRILKFDHVGNFAIAGAHNHNRMRGEVEFVRLGLGYLFSKRRRHVMELDTGRHRNTDQFRRAGLRLRHVQVFEHNLFGMKLCSAVKLMVREGGAIAGLVFGYICSTYDLGRSGRADARRAHDAALFHQRLHFT